MRWDFGTVLKEIRQSKGLTQLEICGNNLSRATLSKIENNKEIPNIENFEHILKQLDMDFAEFSYICHTYLPLERSKIIQHFENSYTTCRTAKNYEKILKESNHYLKTHNDLPIENIAKISHLCLSICQNGDNEQSYFLAQELWKKLDKCDTWYLSDLRKLNAAMILFPIEQLIESMDKILLSLKKYKNFKEIKSWEFALLTNMSTIFLNKGMMEECLKITKITYQIAQETLRVDQLSFATIRLGICQKDSILVETGLQLLKLANLESMLQGCTTEIERYM